EWRKRLTTTLRDSPPIVLIDNLSRTLDSPVVARLLTTDYWEDRLLGTNTKLRFPIRGAIVATGNNPSVSAEISRRCVRIRLNAKVHRPWLRNGFKHADLRGWMRSNRPAMIVAARTRARAWFAVGRPGAAHDRKI